MPNNTLTASRQNTFLTCQRKHYWQCEVGLRHESSSLALRFGSAWHRAMEAYWKGMKYDDCLAYAIPQGAQLGAYECSKVAALLAGYIDRYGPARKFGKMIPERQFEDDICDGWKVAGKLDVIGQKLNGLSGIIEAKTTGDSIEADSDYWLRLNFNPQLYQYYLAAINQGWKMRWVLYDVVKKPTIKPKQITDLDDKGLKVVLDKEGNRVYDEKNIEVKKGKKTVKQLAQVPRQSASDKLGYVVKTHLETPDEYCDRLYKDTKERPDFYFKRREVTVLASDVSQFKSQRISIIQQIESSRKHSETLEHPEDAWPRNVGMMACRSCEFKSFCLINLRVDLNSPPQGFAVKPFNPELEQTNDDETVET